MLLSTDAPPRPPSPGKELLRPDDFYSHQVPPKSPTREQDGYLSDRGQMSPKPHDKMDAGMKRRHHDE